MTPTEKAKQLFDKFMPLVEAYSPDGQKANAKECCIILIDEVIDNIEDDYFMNEHYYWNEVKNEINNL